MEQQGLEHLTKDDRIYIDDALFLASGTDPYGNAKSSVSFHITHQKKDGTPFTYREEIVTLPFTFYCSKGAVVAVCEFPPEETAAFSVIYNECHNYLLREQKGKTREDEFLSFMVLPLILDGQLMIILHNLLYCDFLKKPNGISHLTLVFDNTETILTTPEGVDYDEIVSEIEAELLSKEAELDREIMELEAEEERLRKEAMNIELGIDELTTNTLEDDEEMTDTIEKNHRVRFGGETDE